MATFLEIEPTTENYWRGIILLGRNVATYKLALAKALLELMPSGKTFVTLEELAGPYTRHLTDHLKKADKQIVMNSSKFLDACRGFNKGKQTQEQLIDAAVAQGFNNVIDAFHIVNNALVPKKFFVDERKTKKGITLTDDLFLLGSGSQGANFPSEVEARWRLVETAWSLQLPPSMLAVQYGPELESLFVETVERRINVTGCRAALNGYQRGKCFYCFKDIVISGAETEVEVDHFFPIGLTRFSEFIQMNLNGVWNLVLSCQDCNRGVGGKSMLVPNVRYLERLHSRNQFFIESHHPLRETLMNQTGQAESERRKYLQTTHSSATVRLLHTWEAIDEYPSAF
ncbi:MAG: HNH endonuclease domain-containing protein [Desulfobacterales bacterium]|nr:HNH endonuclease domain-containing protein [Desulfobacterales bacterium]